MMGILLSLWEKQITDVAEAVSEYRKNGLKNCTEFDDAYMKELDTLIDDL